MESVQQYLETIYEAYEAYTDLKYEAQNHRARAFQEVLSNSTKEKSFIFWNGKIKSDMNERLLSCLMLSNEMVLKLKKFVLKFAYFSLILHQNLQNNLPISARSAISTDLLRQ